MPDMAGFPRTVVPLTSKGDILTFDTGNQRLPVGPDGQVLTADSTQPTGLKYAAAVGGGSAWTQVVAESGSTITNWTSLGGTWASNGTQITQTDATGSDRALRYNTKQPVGLFVFQTDIKIVSASSFFVGFGIDQNGSSSISGWVCGLIEGNSTNTTTIANNTTGVGGNTVGITSIAHGTFITLRCVVENNAMDFFINGVYQSSIQPRSPTASVDSVMLYTNGASVQFQNIKMWVPTLPP
jgi:hypothetical protein